MLEIEEKTLRVCSSVGKKLSTLSYQVYILTISIIYGRRPFGWKYLTLPTCAKRTYNLLPLHKNNKLPLINNNRPISR
mgnify:CR=1 FL=1